MSSIANQHRRGRLGRLAPVAVALALAVSACGGGGGSSTDSEQNGDVGANVGDPQPGGSLTVLEDAAFAGSWPSGLDPATNTTGGANLSPMQAIYGGLFLLRSEEDGSNASIEPNQAESYQFLDGGRTLEVKLRDGITFSDGTPLDAEAVAWNWQRDSTSPCSCAPLWQLREKDPFEVVDKLTVRVHLAQPNGALINSFPVSNINWMASPTAVKKMGVNQFKLKPVGAGPFTVKSNQLSSELVLQKNPDYFKADEGLPYLDGLTIKSIGGDQPAYQALQAGQAQAYEGMSTTPLIEQAQQNQDMVVTLGPPTSPYVIQLNTFNGPFKSKKAREAIYAATDFAAIGEGLFGGKYPVSQTFTAAGGLFHQEEVAGYPPHDLDKAKQLVSELGGLKVHLGTTSIYTANQVITALETQWEEAGIEVETDSYQLQQVINHFGGGTWDAMLQTAGAWDPAAGVGVSFRFASTSPYTGVRDDKLDTMLNEAVATTDQARRGELYKQAGEYIAQNLYAPFGLAFSPANIVTSGVHGPGLTTPIPAIAVNSGVVWDEVWREQ